MFWCFGFTPGPVVAAPDQQTPRGRRDRASLLFLARTGASVSEAIGVNAGDFKLDRSRPQVLLRGKGRKERIVPIPNDLTKTLEALMSERGIAIREPRPLFVGTHDTRLTRFGATHIVRRAVATATLERPVLARKAITPHVFRHSLAMKLLQSGVDLLTIQAWLGHSQVATTHRYAAADVEIYAIKFEKAVECLSKARDALLAFYDFPAEHWKHLRTSNPFERTDRAPPDGTLEGIPMEQNRSRHRLQASSSGRETLAASRWTKPIAKGYPLSKVH